MSAEEYYTKATKLEQIDNAVRIDVPIGPGHPFFTDFSDVRGDFEDKMIYSSFNVALPGFTYNEVANRNNKTLLFLAGMRGSGKTTELAKYVKKLHKPDCFFCVTCNLEDGLDMNNMEYMDILIFQVERLFEEAKNANLKIHEDIISSLKNWFTERVEEANHLIKAENGLEISLEAGTPGLLGFLKLATKIKANLTGTKENATKVRSVFKNNFTDFARKVNEFINTINIVIREQNLGRELLFIIDGIEKTGSHDIRRQIIIGEYDRIRQIKAHTIFTMPIELMPESMIVMQMAEVVSFPFVKLQERDGSPCQNDVIARFEEFTYKRIDASLFDKPETVRKAIAYGGGSPREYLRVLQYANMYADETIGKIDEAALEKGVKKLAARTSQYITENDLTLLKKLKEANDKKEQVPYGADWQDLLEKLIVLEYNDGTYKRVNPVVAESALYKQYVG